MKPEEVMESLPEAKSETIAWTASEFIAHHKASGWYLTLGLGAAVVAIVLYFVTRDFVTPAVIVVAAIVFGIFASHQPNEIEYELGSQTLRVGHKVFHYADFRSYSIVPEQAFSSIVFMPLKRFAVPLTIYYAPQDEEAVVGALADKLPLEQQKPDAVDRLMRRVRF
jgi:hypothetical protein